MRRRDGGEAALEVAGFRRERVGEEECYVMRPGNLNIPWLTVLERKLEGGRKK